MDKYYLAAIIAFIVVLIAQGYVKWCFHAYSKKPLVSGITGQEVARRILDKNGLYDVSVIPVAGKMTDHYNPKARTVNLSEEVFDKSSIAAAAVAAHECGHAIQHQNEYVFIKLRDAIMPTVIFSSKWSIFIFISGFYLSRAVNSIGFGIMMLAIVLYAFAVLFQLITLPVEFNASFRAKSQLTSMGIIGEREIDGASSVLIAAALTYVAGLLQSMVELLRLIVLARGSKRRD